MAAHDVRAVGQVGVEVAEAAGLHQRLHVEGMLGGRSIGLRALALLITMKGRDILEYRLVWFMIF